MSMPIKKTYLQQNINGEKTKIYAETSADQVFYNDTTVEKELDKLNKGGGGAGALYSADNVKFNINNLSSLNGKDLENFSFIDLMNTLNYSKASVSLLSNLSTLVYEAGVIVHGGITLTAKVTKGSSKITQVEFFKDSTSVSTITTGVEDGGNFTYADGTDISNDITFKVSVKCEDNSTAESTLSIKFYNPYYYGITTKQIDEITESDITSLTKDVSAKATKNYTYTSNNEYCVIAYPKSYGLLKSILDPNGFQNLDSMGHKEVTVKGVPYYIYQTNTTVTCTDFTYAFSY